MHSWDVEVELQAECLKVLRTFCTVVSCLVHQNCSGACYQPEEGYKAYRNFCSIVLATEEHEWGDRPFLRLGHPLAASRKQALCRIQVLVCVCVCVCVAE